MTLMWLNLLFAAAPPWLVWSLTAAEPAPVTATPHFVVRVGDGTVEVDGAVVGDPAGADEEPAMIWVTADGEGGCGSGESTGTFRFVGAPEGAMEGEGTRHVIVRAVAGDGDGRDTSGRTALVRVQKKGDAADSADRGWLGVSIAEVPAALSAQLGAGVRGVLVSNVVSGSPADQAGFQAHDIIVSLNGEPVEGETMRAVDLIKSRKPGEPVNVVVLRNGEEATLTATLGSRADAGPHTFTWKFETAPQGEVEESIRTKGKLLHKGPGGEWVFKDLGDLEALKSLPDGVKMFFPKSGDQTTQVFVENGKKTVKMKVERDGGVVTIERTDDGPITVMRKDAGGAETTATYDDEDALAAGDADAAELLGSAGHSITLHLDADGTVDGDFDFDFDFDPTAIKNYAYAFGENLEEAKEAYEKAMEQLHESMSKLHQGDGWQGKAEELHKMFQQHGQGFGAALMGKPKHTFETRTDGTIEVRIRKGDSELVQLYKNETDLKQRNVEMYDKYKDLITAKE